MRDIGLWVWLSWNVEGPESFEIEPRAHDIHSATVAELERYTKALRTLQRKMPTRDMGEGFESYLRRVLFALGIREVIEYHGINEPDTFAPVAKAVPDILATYRARLSECERARRAA